MAGFPDLFRWTAFFTAMGSVVLTGCTEKAGGPTIALEHLGSSEPLPMSGSNKFAVAGPDFACLFDSYEKELACGDLSWSDTLRFGRSGKGPGELGNYGPLVSTSNGSVGFVDLPNNRISVFTRQGYAEQFPLPDLLMPASDISSDGTYAGFASIPTQGGGGITLQELRAATAELVGEVRLEIDGVGMDGQQVLVTGAARLRNGDFIVKTGSGITDRMQYFTSEGTSVGQLKMPEFPPQLPDTRDVELFKEGMAIFPRGPVFDRVVGKFAEKPLRRLARNSLFRIVQMDPEGRVLILTTHRSPTGTYVEVYSGLDYVGRGHLRGRVLAIQVVDSILVTLTEEMQTEDLIPKRRLEWYGFRSGTPLGH